MSYILPSLLGLVAGFSGGLLGVGGGFIMVPVFYYVLKLDIKQAIGTSMALIVANSIAGSIIHYKNGFVNTKVFFACVFFIVAGSFAGAYVMKYIDPGIIRKMFAVLLLVIAVKMYFGDKLP